MANAISRISVARGYDVADYVLNTFGGAGGQHACLVADHLGITRVFLHPLAGVLSAYGVGIAEQTTMRERSAELELTQTALPALTGILDAAEVEARSELAAQRVAASQIVIVRNVQLRYQGTDTPVTVPFGPPALDARSIHHALSATIFIPHSGTAHHRGHGQCRGDRPRWQSRPGRSCAQ